MRILSSKRKSKWFWYDVKGRTMVCVLHTLMSTLKSIKLPYILDR